MPEPRPSGKPLVVGAGVMVLFGAGLLYALWPRARTVHTGAASSERSAAERVEASSAPHDQPAKPSKPRPQPEPRKVTAEALPPLDLFSTPGPELIDMAHKILERGESVSLTKLKEVYQFAKEHPGDARPHLIMAADAMHRGWHDQAIGHYVRAAKEDPRARQDEHMLSDLIKSAGREHSFAAASDAIVQIYGNAAFDRVQATIAEVSGDEDEGRMTRLSELLVRLEASPSSGPNQK